LEKRKQERDLFFAISKPHGILTVAPGLISIVGPAKLLYMDSCKSTGDPPESNLAGEAKYYRIIWIDEGCWSTYLEEFALQPPRAAGRGK
jgi:hypothetical protein